MADEIGDGDDELLVSLLESELFSDPSDSEREGVNDEERRVKKQRLEKGGISCAQIETGFFSKIPPELFHHIFKFLSSEDLISCTLVCRFMSFAASDETLWRRLYCMRWGAASATGNFRASAWKKLYIQRDEEDMVEFVRNCPMEFKEYYIQMQAAKRSQAPLPSQVNDDSIILDRTVADQVSMWKSKRGLTDDELVIGHVCSGNTCSYTKIGDVFICEKTGRVHVCDDTCREVVLDQSSGTLVCTISGHCYDRWLSPDEETDTDADQQQGGVTDEAEPFMGSGRFARAYLLGYNCVDEKELEDTLRFC
ncbi:F-box protein SKIP31 [Rhynchospora pubera]|uniref:F-box protein SKIP31 n=1 Tax=Rhynchospora pubera TaxID=906938 RepID=A0AAV8GJE9_9POAL|nr:F-box protein SKIP31 [Rhynchospora pubera]